MIRKIIALIFLAWGLIGCSKSGVESPSQFTRTFASRLGAASTNATITVVKSLELQVVTPTGQTNTAYLANAYDDYKSNSGQNDRDKVINHYVSAFQSIWREPSAGKLLDVTRIVPIIKDRDYLDEMKKLYKQRGIPMEKFDLVYEDYNAELLIFYAEDTPDTLHYLTSNQLAEAKLQRADLLPLAITNLTRLLPPIRVEGSKGVFMVKAGGDYEASLLLLDSVWKRNDLKVNGELIAAIPSRGVLVVIGGENSQKASMFRDLAKKWYEEAPHRLTPALFVYREGKFQVFDE